MQSVRVNHAHYAVEKSQARYNVQLCVHVYSPALLYLELDQKSHRG